MAGKLWIRSLFAFGLVALAATGCGDDDKEAAASITPTTCAEAAAVTTEDAFDVARQVIDAAQVWDGEALCSLVGRLDIPSGLIEYRQAIIDGLSTDIELIKQQDDPAVHTANYVFEIPAPGSGTRLGLAFQRQSNGWVLLMAPFIPKG